MERIKHLTENTIKRRRNKRSELEDKNIINENMKKIGDKIRSRN